MRVPESAFCRNCGLHCRLNIDGTLANHRSGYGHCQGSGTWPVARGRR